MKHKGFTLVEVLVVFMVLGIIAVLTLPAILSNIQKHQVGPALTKAMATLETANALMINEHEMNSLLEGCNIDNGYVYRQYTERCFEPYIMKTISATKDTASAAYDKLNNSGVFLDANPSTVDSYTTKSGITYIFEKQNETSSIWITLDNGRLMKFYIDINGISKKPNIYGKDLFAAQMLISSEGQIIADGSKYFSQLISQSATPNQTWVVYCNNTTRSNLFTGKFCAGSVIDNGGKVIYPWK